MMNTPFGTKGVAPKARGNVRLYEKPSPSIPLPAEGGRHWLE
ncbi:MAG: hypothetical protein OJF61_002872 [Rhodanobacteraceae bacterium]|nr:MAG: hypothetical protein OJF61_002872 [Rhodanobacteraceae bacterium]